MKVEDIEFYVFYNNLYSKLAQVYNNVSRCANYLCKELDSGEEVLTACFSTIEYPNANKKAAYLLLFTDKRIIIGYKYLFGLLKKKMEISYSSLNGLIPQYDNETGKITIDTKSGKLSFYIKGLDTYRDESGRGTIIGSTVDAFHFVSKLEYCFVQNIIKVATGEELDMAKNIEKKTLDIIEKLNDNNKAYLFAISNNSTLTQQESETIIKSGWVKFVEANPSFKDYNVNRFYPL